MHGEDNCLEDRCVFGVEWTVNEYVAVELWIKLRHRYFFEVTRATACSILFLPRLLGSVGKSTTRPVFESAIRPVLESRLTNLPVA